MTIPNELAKLALFIVVLCDFLITAKRTNNERRENSLVDHLDELPKAGLTEEWRAGG
ncbi:hypothetical protein [Cedecea lapagei]|uniref:hypothetical protein n=1 Tax=Cedecea lapagei TaxID=158823 RepID=UPI0013DE816B|nr:hypothetical protein [Cedecea lapagei]